MHINIPQQMMLTFDQSQRITARESLKHSYFADRESATYSPAPPIESTCDVSTRSTSASTSASCSTSSASFLTTNQSLASGTASRSPLRPLTTNLNRDPLQPISSVSSESPMKRIQPRLRSSSEISRKRLRRSYSPLPGHVMQQMAGGGGGGEDIQEDGYTDEDEEYDAGDYDDYELDYSSCSDYDDNDYYNEDDLDIEVDEYEGDDIGLAENSASAVVDRVCHFSDFSASSDQDECLIQDYSDSDVEPMAQVGGVNTKRDTPIFTTSAPQHSIGNTFSQFLDNNENIVKSV